ncbi:hypothetical protein [Nannocystis pusilla]|uniref:hypothetical protein n=1 Tax=Nannocystis pusilla TaxID=889268 RepID=UPI003B7A7202
MPPGFDQSGFTHITEYDPDFNPLGIQAFTSLGPAGPAPVVFPFDPKSGHVTPMPAIFQNPEVYNRKGRTFNTTTRSSCSPATSPAASRT